MGRHKQIFFQRRHQFSSVQSLSCVQLFATPWTAAPQASLSITNSWSLLKLMSIEPVMPSNHLILCHPLLLPPSIFPTIRVFSNESDGQKTHEKISTVLIILEMQIKTTMWGITSYQWGITSYQSEWPSLKLQTINSGEGVEKREPSYSWWECKLV